MILLGTIVQEIESLHAQQTTHESNTCAVLGMMVGVIPVKNSPGRPARKTVHGARFSDYTGMK